MVKSKQCIYLDNAATSFPKAPGVIRAVTSYMDGIGANVNRNTSKAATDAEMILLETRELLAQLFHFSDDPRQVVFTPGATYGLNQVLRGYLSPGDHVLVSSLEHNAVMRPLQELACKGVEFDRIPADEKGITRAEDMIPLLRNTTKLVVISHASNVCGAIFPLKAVADLCAVRGIPLVVDAAQTAGYEDIDFDALGLAALCVPGHKGLLGPQGIGAVLMRRDFAHKLRPIVSGGTGSASDSENQPDYLPDKFESGTMNLPGIFGWNAALNYLREEGIDKLRNREKLLTARFLRGVARISGIRIVGPGEPDLQTGVVSIEFLNCDNAEAAFILENRFSIVTRCGLHCAPNAHKVLNTFPQGTVRFSFGYKTTEAEIDATIAAIGEIAGN